MSRTAFLPLLESRSWLLADGATGTNYFQMGLTSGDAPELWNFDHVDRVRSLHRRFIDADAAVRLVAVAGSMGPTGEIFEPVGTLSHADGVAAFAEQAAALKEGGVDVLWIETMSSREELAAA